MNKEMILAIIVAYKAFNDKSLTIRTNEYVVDEANIDSIDGDKCYSSLTDLPVVPNVVDFVVPEKVGLAAVDECKVLGIPTVWLQPGADKPAVVKKATEVGLNVIEDCVLVQLP